MNEETHNKIHKPKMYRFHNKHEDGMSQETLAHIEKWERNQNRRKKSKNMKEARQFKRQVHAEILNHDLNGE